MRRPLPLAFAMIATASLVASAANAAPSHDHTTHDHSHGPDAKALDPRGRARVAGAPYEVDTHAPWSASDYDGQSFTADQRDLTILPQVHALYVYPSNGANRFTQFAAMFQADARQTAALLHGHQVRWDERGGADVTTRYLDITVFRSRHNAKKLAGSQQFSLVAQELAERGFTNPDKKYVVWLDAGSRYCGQGHLSQDTQRTLANANNRRTLSIVYRPYATNNGEGGFCRGRTLLHELGHNFGAVLSAAPNDFDGAHCNDSAEDVMCYTSRTSYDSGGPVFDWNNDDYWDPAATGADGVSGKLPWWTSNLSRFLCPVGGDCSSPSAADY